MYSTYRLRAEELSSNLIKAIKDTYHDREIEITVQEILDETEYLLSTAANREHLLKSIENITKHTNLVQMNLEEF
jgi:PHD/YefM family antitoxin component YafN of YafNO toxin-antitoxin module